MNKFTFKTIISVILLVMSLIEKIVKIVDFLIDLLDDGEINSSAHQYSLDLKAFQSDLLDWSHNLYKFSEDYKQYDLD